MHTQDPLKINNDESSQQPQIITTAADLILHYLEQIGIDYVFGIPGGGIEPLYNALARSGRRGGPRAVIARHESGAAFMADGYARETGKLGVCCATTGPGATNMITGVASAYMDHIPMLAITAQTSLKSFGRGAAQESSCTGIDTVGMYQYCTRYNTLVSHIDQLERKLISAITTAIHPPSGPVHLSIPVDILREQVTLKHATNLASLLSSSAAIDGNAIDQLYRTFYSSRSIVFVLGPRSRNAADVILELAVLINAQVVTTPDARGVVSSFHPMYRGVYGISGHITAHNLLLVKSVDLIIAIGINLDEFSTNGWAPSELFSDKTVFIDSSIQYFSRAPQARRHMTGNISEIFERLLARYQRIRKSDIEGAPLCGDLKSHDAPIIPFERRASVRRRDSSHAAFKGITHLPSNERRKETDRRTGPEPSPVARRFVLDDEEKYVSESSPIKPQRLMYDLSRLFPPGTRFLADNGNSSFWAIHYLHPSDSRMMGRRTPAAETMRFGMGFLAMGWAIGAAIGTAISVHDHPVVCITGDGSLLMSGQELSVAVQEKLPVIFVVLNDAALGTVKHGQRLGNGEPIGFELPKMNFAAYAKALGAAGYIINSPQSMADLDIRALCKQRGPTVLDVRIDAEETPPIASRIKMLNA